ncbi:pyruvate dehydrogenase E2 component (dihydrolipoamide acetyltransferase) [Pseudonocardia thermophila]|jgi:Predicted hydrolases or acyltransferases (alpha/beta hydrolase superfamily)|uniref:Pyruvate dehydrogenase E2 component (Dihydrolipoamide acetyltransferase) n=1 Tax=Pseudonocardia thermophila TaxID=1848 RepID=A0A1M6WUS9_PSETH|nr:alpha/beta hydrolase [Pseudonocardia thermophila]SHK97458.1 pyruvate dehydrogenase E2 component (dihydrolipoamide acetyltransferase) [Pseudonocardia thermophila]
MSPDENTPTAWRAGPIAYLHWAGAPHRVPILFLHPVNTAAAVWRHVVTCLAGERAAIAVDYRGHGRSASGGPYLPRDYAEDALRVLDDARVARAHVVCGSIGGAVAVELAALAPDRVLSICAFGAGLRIGWSEEQLQAVETELRRVGVRAWFTRHGAGILGPDARPGAARELAELASRGVDGPRDPDVVVEVIRATFGQADSRPAAQRLRQPPPARVFVGLHDPTCPLEAGRELAKYLGGEVDMMPGLGHLPMLEDPRATAAAIREFLAGLDG